MSRKTISDTQAVTAESAMIISARQPKNTHPITRAGRSAIQTFSMISRVVRLPLTCGELE